AFELGRGGSEGLPPRLRIRRLRNCYGQASRSKAGRNQQPRRHRQVYLARRSSEGTADGQRPWWRHGGEIRRGEEREVCQYRQGRGQVVPG
ncbi:unnamed protein product, partial [Polarella glacialis]